MVDEEDLKRRIDNVFEVVREQRDFISSCKHARAVMETFISVSFLCFFFIYR